MPVITLPSIWDYIGQAAGNAGQQITSADAAQQAEADRQGQQTRQDAQFIAQMVSSGAMDSDTANNTDTAKQLGLHFQPSAAELKRKILASPSGIPGTGLPAGGPDDSGNISSPATSPTPWSPDQRFAAGLPSAGAMAGDKLQAQVADIKQRYATDPKSITDPEARLAGLPTASDAAIADRQKLDPVVSTAAQKYVAEALNSTLASGTIDPSTPQGLKSLRRQSASLSAAAYNKYITDAKVSNDPVALDPKNQGYIKTFFDSAVEDQLSKTEDQVIRTKALTPQKTEMTGVDWYKQMMDTSARLDAEIKTDRADPTALIAMTAKNKTPDQQQTVDDLHKKEMQSIAYRKAGLAFVSSSANPEVIRQSLAAELDKIDKIGGQPAAAPNTGQPTGTKPPPRQNGATPDQIKQVVDRVRSKQASISDVQSLVRNGTITNEDFQAILKQLKTP